MTATYKPQSPDITDQRFGRLRAIRRVDRRGNWECACICGGTTVTRSHALRNGYTRSCGCLRYSPTHESGGDPRRSIWRSMLRRCYSKSYRSYPCYGGRGIAVCERWKTFENFSADMGPCPSGMSLDRIDNNGDYEPGNCRWATAEQQYKNRRTGLALTHNGKTQTLRAWCRELRIPYHRTRYRIQQGWSLERAATTPNLRPRYSA